MLDLERRQTPRAKFSGITFVRANGGELTCIAGDLSESGMMLYPQVSSSPAPGTPLQLTFTLPESASWIEVDGTLVRQGQHKARSVWGIRFAEISSHLRETLRSYVCDRRPSYATPPRPLMVEVPPPQRVLSARASRRATTESEEAATVRGGKLEPTREMMTDAVAAVLDVEDATRQVTPDQIIQSTPTDGEETSHGRPAELAMLQERCRKN